MICSALRRMVAIGASAARWMSAPSASDRDGAHHGVEFDAVETDQHAAAARQARGGDPPFRRRVAGVVGYAQDIAVGPQGPGPQRPAAGEIATLRVFQPIAAPVMVGAEMFALLDEADHSLEAVDGVVGDQHVEFGEHAFAQVLAHRTLRGQHHHRDDGQHRQADDAGIEQRQADRQTDARPGPHAAEMR